jgi:hypothetical protein
MQYDLADPRIARGGLPTFRHRVLKSWSERVDG